MPNVLYVCRDHPSIQPGRVAVYAHELFCAVRAQGEFEAVLVAGLPPSMSERLHQTEGSRFGLIDGDPTEYFFHMPEGAYDDLLGSARDKRIYIDDWRQFLEAQHPAVVHVHHTYSLGYDLLRVARATLPNAAIVYSLHDFRPICHHDGVMVRTDRAEGADGELCTHASPRRCHQCFPAIPAQRFFLRERLIKSALEHVDLFIVGTEFERGRYSEWGLPDEKLRRVPYGWPSVPATPDPPDAGRRRRIAFFGRLSGYDGADVLLRAMTLLDSRGVDVHLSLWDDAAGVQPDGFEIARLLDRAPESVTLAGRYSRAELGVLMADADWVVVPSAHWEAGPGVILDALAHRRPVICANLGTPAEQIRDGENGLLFRFGDPNSLADAIASAVGSPELWTRLRDRLEAPPAMDAHAAAITDIYRRLLETSQLAAA